MSSDADSLDVDFYRAQYLDMGTMSKAAARRHYDRHGRVEGRLPNAEVFLRGVEAREGAAPADFDWSTYLALNPDLAASHPLRWQATAHFLSDGRREGRRYSRSEARADAVPTGLPVRVTRSVTEGLRRALQVALGDGLDDAFVRKVHLAQRAAAMSATVAAPLMDPVLIARYHLMHADTAFEFSRLEVQLRALLRVAFSPEGARDSRAAERNILDRIRASAIATAVATPADPRLPPVTLLMMAAQASLTDDVVVAPREEDIFRALGRFFVIEVPRLGLERFITLQQRALLRAPHAGGAPLAARMLDAVAPMPRSGPDGRTSGFWEEDVWRAGLAYVFGCEQLEAAQLRVETGEQQDRVLGPDWLLPPGCGADPSWAERQAAEAWLRTFVLEGLTAERLPHVLVGPSAVRRVANLQPVPAAQASMSPGRGRKPLRPGSPVSLAWDGGAQHLVGPGWSYAEDLGRWTTSVGALIAITLDEADLGPLDLFITLAPGAGVGRTISLTWNGCPVATLRPMGEGFVTVNCYLGRLHRSGVATNILGLNVERTFTLAGEPRSLGVCVRDFMLVRR